MERKLDPKAQCETVKNARDIIFDEHDEENKNKPIEVLSAESSKIIHFPTEPQDNGIQINDVTVQSDLNDRSKLYFTKLPAPAAIPNQPSPPSPTPPPPTTGNVTRPEPPAITWQSKDMGGLMNPEQVPLFHAHLPANVKNVDSAVGA
ncbi:hypothetical protein DAPPUDRAFT_331486 [Daphnia pulex]|uniref:Uncharacterized protein n=1 Tax=Daphnia pulex TaxID=6669 RepID=E9HMM3_DAPPU|nr:hypothetical protein DAPPUDRAFT_331486 [Daphnia pulex]|eukprot:EFX66991.1 hypothetical protein DAPPUDRAFT_331486 [Daphnia pulex]